MTTVAGDTVVRIRSGAVRGVAIDGATVWRAIPYAAAPVGALRFAPPQPAPSWSGVRDATEHGPRAWQSEPAPNPLMPDAVITACDEDCLHLSVTVPDGDAPPGGWPVLVWVHGGGYVLGSGSAGAVGDGVELARFGMIVVTFNYRLGSLGFLHVGDALGADGLDSGASGLRDQVAAVQWVRDNIAAFGGDPAHVSLYGVSAGAKSVVNLLAAPPLRAAVFSAISASGGGDHVASAHQAQHISRLFLSKLGLTMDQAQLLRGVRAAEMVGAQEAIGRGPSATWIWRPVLGGPALPKRPIDAIAAGAARTVPLLAGGNGNEGITYQAGDPTAAEQAPQVLGDLFGAARAMEMLAGYRMSLSARGLPSDDTAVGVAVLGDERYGIPTTRLADAQSGFAPVWRYRFDRRFPGMPATMNGGHGADLMPIWAPIPRDAPDDEGLLATAAAMRARWAGMVLHGDPNALIDPSRVDPSQVDLSRVDPSGAGDALPSWAPYDAVRRPTLVIDAEARMVDDPVGEVRALWGEAPWPSGTWWAY